MITFYFNKADIQLAVFNDDTNTMEIYLKGKEGSIIFTASSKKMLREWKKKYEHMD